MKVHDQIEDIDVEAIDTKEVMEADERLENITNYILANHNAKTHNREFTAIMCVPNIDVLAKYYKLFEDKKQAGAHDLRIGTIFSFGANEPDPEEATGLAEPNIDMEGKTVNVHHRDKLESYMANYNAMFTTNYSTKNFYGYYKDIGKRVRNKEIDILLVVNMFLTGFDSKSLNTIYVDKNLKYHGLIQAYSRTNRILGAKKSQGNVVCFRNLKPNTDKAVELFANKNAIEDIILAPYTNYIENFNEAVKVLRSVTPDVGSVDDLLDEDAEAMFIQAFRELMRIKNVLACFTEFTFADLDMSEQEFADFRSKYLDLYDKVKNDNEKEKVSILDDIDFELELIRRDTINVSYIISLLQDMKEASPAARVKKQKAILDMLDSEAQLRSKKELIEKFIKETFEGMPEGGDMGAAFDNFMSVEKQKAIEVLSSDENLNPDGLYDVISSYNFTGKLPLRDDVISIMQSRPSLKERKSTAERIIGKIKDWVETFVDGVD